MVSAILPPDLALAAAGTWGLAALLKGLTWKSRGV